MSKLFEKTEKIGEDKLKNQSSAKGEKKEKVDSALVFQTENFSLNVEADSEFKDQNQSQHDIGRKSLEILNQLLKLQQKKEVEKAKKKTPWYQNTIAMLGLFGTLFAAGFSFYFAYFSPKAKTFEDMTEAYMFKQDKICKQTINDNINKVLALTPIFDDIPYNSSLYAEDKLIINSLMESNNGRTFYVLEGISQIGNILTSYMLIFLLGKSTFALQINNERISQNERFATFYISLKRPFGRVVEKINFNSVFGCEINDFIFALNQTIQSRQIKNTLIIIDDIQMAFQNPQDPTWFFQPICGLTDSLPVNFLFVSSKNSIVAKIKLLFFFLTIFNLII